MPKCFATLLKSHFEHLLSKFSGEHLWTAASELSHFQILKLTGSLHTLREKRPNTELFLVRISLYSD